MTRGVQTRDEMVASAQRALMEKTDGDLLSFGRHCASIGVQPGSVLADALALEVIRRGLNKR